MSIAIATALATGQSRLLKNSSQSTRPIMSASGPPSSAGITNSPTAGMKTSMQPAMIPARVSGTVMQKKVLTGRQPRSAAASSKELSSFSIEV